MKKGFTLIELLIAISMLAVVMLVVYSSFSCGIFGYRNIEDTIDTYQASRIIINRMNLDLRNAFIYSKDKAGFIGSSEEMNFFTLVDRYAEDKILPEIASVSYKLENGKLMRRARKGHEALKDDSLILAEEMYAQAKIKFEYGYMAAGTQEISFKDSWGDAGSPSEVISLPSAVKVELILTGKSKEKFQRVIYLPLGQ